MHGAQADSGTAAGRRWKVLALLAALALLLHAGALSGIDWAWPRQVATPRSADPMQVRAVAEAPPAAVAASPAPMPIAVEPMPAAPRPVSLRVAAVAAPAAKAVVAAAPPPAPPDPAPGPAAAEAEAEAAASPAEETIPHYRTRLPPPVTLRYDLQRGALRGNGELQWRPAAERYELRLEGRVAGLAVLTQVSQGGFDDAGIAPLRFTDRRVRRQLSAANFQRDAGKITYSGPQVVYPLQAGAQDRLSWMIELGAIVAAEPALALPGAKVLMFVTGAHGDAGVWSFRCIGADAVESRAGSVAALRFRREPRGPYDTTVEVWLDPKRHHLPVRAAWRAGPNDEGIELHLQDMDTPP